MKILLIFALICATAFCDYACLPNDENTKCPYFKTENFGKSNIPSTPDIKLTPIINQDGETSIMWTVPFCRKCGVIFSLYPISYEDGYPQLTNDPKYTSIGEDLTGNRTWGDFWRTGDSNCDATYPNNPLNTATQLFDRRSVSPCFQQVWMQFMDFKQKKDFLLPNDQKVYAYRRTAEFAELTTAVFLQVVYPYSFSNYQEKYSTRRATHLFTTRYNLRAEVHSDIQVITQKEILVKTTATLPVQLQAVLSLKAATGFYFVQDSCKMSNGLWGATVKEMTLVNGVATLTIESSESLPTYTGKMNVHCYVEECYDGYCEPAKRTDVAVEVDQSTPTAVTTTTRFNPFTAQFVGPASSPFQQAKNLASSGNHYISIGIGNRENIVDFSSHINYLRICSETCSVQSEHKITLIRDSNIITSEESNALGFKVWSNAEMRSWRGDLKGGATLGFSLLYDAVKEMKYNVWTFEIGISFTPLNKKRAIGASTETEENNNEETTVVETVELIPTGDRITVVPENREGSHTPWYVNPSILVPIAVPMGLAMCLALVALLAFGVVIVVVRRVRNKDKEDADEPALLEEGESELMDSQ